MHREIGEELACVPDEATRDGLSVHGYGQRTEQADVDRPRPAVAGRTDRTVFWLVRIHAAHALGFPDFLEIWGLRLSAGGSENGMLVALCLSFARSVITIPWNLTGRLMGLFIRNRCRFRWQDFWNESKKNFSSMFFQVEHANRHRRSPARRCQHPVPVDLHLHVHALMNWGFSKLDHGHSMRLPSAEQGTQTQAMTLLDLTEQNNNRSLSPMTVRRTAFLTLPVTRQDPFVSGIQGCAAVRNVLAAGPGLPRTERRDEVLSEHIRDDQFELLRMGDRSGEHRPGRVGSSGAAKSEQPVRVTGE